MTAAVRIIECELDVSLRCDHGSFLAGVVVTEWRGLRRERLLIYKPLVNPLPLRIQSGCLLGFVGGDLACDCRTQASTALAQFERTGMGLLVYCPEQDGRGRGLASKLRVRREQQTHGGSARDACMRLGEPYDVREFEEVGHILRHLGVTRIAGSEVSVAKRSGLVAAGLRVEPVA